MLLLKPHAFACPGPAPSWTPPAPPPAPLPDLVEVELQLLVGYVDAELLEAVLLEVLEARDVEDSDRRAALVSETMATTALQ